MSTGRLPGPGAKVVAYFRYSTSHQDQRSLEGQDLVCRQFEDKHEWDRLAAFQDAEKTGTTTYGREGLFQLIAYIERGGVDVVLVEDIDRLSRSAADMHMLAQTIEEAGAVLVTVAGGVMDDLQLGFKAIQNQQYVRQTAQKTRRGQELAVEQGRISGSLTYGHRKVQKFDERGKPINGLRELDKAQSEVVLWIFEEYVSGRSTIDICRDLNARGEPAPRGGAWGAGALTGSVGASLGILRNRLYIGEFHWGRTKRRRKAGKVVTKPSAATDRKISMHPDLAFVPRELFDAAQERLTERGKGRFNEWRKTDYLFSRKLYCGLCGSRMAVLNKRLGCMGKSRKGICDNGRRVPREELEEACIEQLKTKLLHNGLIESSLVAYRDEAERLQAEYQAKASSATSRLAEINRELPSLTQKYIAAEGYLADVLKREIETREAERQRLERDLAARPRTNSGVLDAATVIPQIEQTIDGLRDALAKDDRESVRAREILRSLFTRIEIKPAPGTKADGRGAGPVVVTVEGPIATLLEMGQITLDQNTQYGSRPETVLDVSTVYFFAFTLEFEDARLAQVIQDMPLIAQALDDSDVPVPKQTFLRLLAEEAGGGSSLGDGLIAQAVGGRKVFSPRQADELEERLRRVLTHLSQKALIRAIRAGPERSGWVWNDVALTDQQWKDRAVRGPVDGYRLPVLRVVAPEASVVVIGPSGSGSVG